MSKNNKPKGIVLDLETADRIALINLQDHVSYLKKSVKDHEKKGTYMHPEDYHNHKINLIPAFELLIKYYGG
jgi:hypothetical protein